MQALNARYAAVGNTHGLQKLYGVKVDLDSKDDIAKNNYAALSLLLKTELDRAHTYASELHAKTPKDVIFASTYACSLHLKGKTKDGLKVLESYSEQQLSQPTVATSYG